MSRMALPPRNGRREKPDIRSPNDDEDRTSFFVCIATGMQFCSNVRLVRLSLNKRLCMKKILTAFLLVPAIVLLPMRVFGQDAPAAPSAGAATLPAETVTIPAGQGFTVKVIDAINLNDLDADQRFHAQFAYPIKLKGPVLIPDGTDVFLKATKEAGDQPNSYRVTLFIDYLILDGKHIEVKGQASPRNISATQQVVHKTGKVVFKLTEPLILPLPAEMAETEKPVERGGPGRSGPQHAPGVSQDRQAIHDAIVAVLKKGPLFSGSEL